MLTDRVTAGRILVNLLWSGNGVERGPLLASTWAIVVRDRVTDMDALEDMDEPRPGVRPAPQSKAETKWLLATRGVREPLSAFNIEGDDWWSHVARFCAGRSVDPLKLALLLAVSPANRMAWVDSVLVRVGPPGGLLGLRDMEPVWFLAATRVGDQE